MIYHSLMNPDSGLYVQQLGLRLHEKLDVSLLKEAWRRLVARYDVLRMRFVETDDAGLMQEVACAVELSWTEADWSHLADDEVEGRWIEFLRDDRRRRFDISRSPLMRLALFRVAGGDHRFLWTFHHALLDGRSHLAALREVFGCYEALLSGEEYNFGDAPAYGEFLRWQSSLDHSRSKEFWLEVLQDFEEPTVAAVMPPESRPATFEEERGMAEALLTGEETRLLEKAAEQAGVTVGTLLQAAWAALLGRYSSESDVVFGATRACRHASIPGSESVLGLLINTVPLRVRIDEKQTVRDWLKDIRSHWVAMRPHEHTPLRHIQEWTGFGPEKPLFETLMVYENFALGERLRSPGGRWEGREIELHERGDYPLVAVAYGGSRLLLHLAYGRDRFGDDTAERILTHWRTLLLGLATHMERRVEELSMLSEDERSMILEDWNDTTRRYPPNLCLHHLFEKQVARTPESTAILFERGSLTYGELNARANRLAHYLRRRGAGPGGRVALCMERTPEIVVALLGVLKAGAAYVPLETGLPRERLSGMLADSEASVALTQSSRQKEFESEGLTTICIDAESDMIQSESDANPEGGASSSDLAYAMYTSGSSGTPKLIGVTHKNAVNCICYTISEVFTAEDLAVVPFADAVTFDPSVYRMFSTFAHGGAVILLASLFDLPGSRWAGSVTYLGSAPSVLTALLTDYTIPPSVRVASFGAEAASEALLEKLAGYPQISKIYNFYGPTEATIYCSRAVIAVRAGKELHGSSPAPLVRVAKGTVIGRPIGNTRIYILDSRMRPVPCGVRGEICVGGDCVAAGYLNEPELTAKKFVPDPFSSEGDARLYRTGDLGRFLPDGNIEFLGRTDSQVKIRGLRVEPQGIEATLGESPAVGECVVRAMRDAHGAMRLVAYVVPRAGDGDAGRHPVPSFEKELREHLAHRLPRWMVPEVFVFIESMPRTIRGKVDFRSLPAPGRAGGRTAHEFVPPRTDTERALAAIWREVLTVEEVGVSDTLTGLGGDSLAAMRVISRVNHAFGTNLSILALFSAPKLAELANLIEENILRE